MNLTPGYRASRLASHRGLGPDSWRAIGRPLREGKLRICLGYWGDLCSREFVPGRARHPRDVS